MSLGGSSNPPPVLGAGQVSDTQQQYNTTAGEQSQAGSNYNAYGPTGTSLTYTQTGTGPNGVPLYSATESLSPAQQNLLNTLQGTQQTAGTAGSNLLAGANYGSTNPTAAIGNESSGILGQVMQQYMTAQSPIMQQQVTQLNNQLANQGITPQSNAVAYNAAMNPLLQSQYQSEQGFEAQVQPQAFNEATSLYQLPEQMATQLSTFGSPNLSADMSTPTGASLNIQPANYTGAVATEEGVQNQQYQTQLQQQNAEDQAIAQLGSQAIGALFGVPSSTLKNLGNTIGNAIIPGNWGGSN